MKLKRNIIYKNKNFVIFCSIAGRKVPNGGGNLKTKWKHNPDIIKVIESI